MEWKTGGRRQLTKMGRQEEVDRKREGKMGGGRQEEEGEEGMRRQEDRLEDRRWWKTGRGRGRLVEEDRKKDGKTGG